MVKGKLTYPQKDNIREAATFALLFMCPSNSSVVLLTLKHAHPAASDLRCSVSFELGYKPSHEVMHTYLATFPTRLVSDGFLQACVSREVPCGNHLLVSLEKNMEVELHSLLGIRKRVSLSGICKQSCIPFEIPHSPRSIF